MLLPTRFFCRKKVGKSSHLVLLFDYFLVTASRHRATLGLVIDGQNAISLVGRIYLSDVARWTRRSTYFSGKYSRVGRWIRPGKENLSPLLCLDCRRHSNYEGHDASSWGKDENWIWLTYINWRLACRRRSPCKVHSVKFDLLAARFRQSFAVFLNVRGR